MKMQEIRRACDLVVIFLVVLGVNCSSAVGPGNPRKLQDPQRRETVTGCKRNHHDIEKALNSIYNKTNILHRPFTNEGKPLDVYIRLELSSVDEVNEEREKMKVTFFLELQWIDERNKFSLGCPHEPLHLGADFQKKIYVPDITAQTSRSVLLHSTLAPDTGFTLFENGTIVMGSRLTMENSCKMELERYPFDSQVCAIEMTSFDNGLRDINLIIDTTKAPVTFANFSTRILGFKVVGFSHYNYIYTTDSNKYTNFGVKLALERNYMYHVFFFFLPLMSVTSLNFMPFYLRSSISERFTIGGSSVVATSTIISVTIILTPSSEYLKATDLYLIFCVLTVLISCFMSMVISSLYNLIKARERGEPLVLGEWLSLSFLLKLDVVCCIAFPLLFIVGNVVYWYHYTSSSFNLADFTPI